MASLRMGNVSISGSVVFEGVSLDTYNKLIALLSEVNATIETENLDLPSHKPTHKIVKKSKAPTLLLPRKDARYFEQKAKWIDKVKALRAEYRLSASEFANKIGYSYATVYGWEHGLGLPSRDAVDEINKAYPDAQLPYILP
jgi:DNA-binding transcriptional regulator YiaG